MRRDCLPSVSIGLVVIGVVWIGVAFAGDQEIPDSGGPVYKPAYKYPVLDDIKEVREARKAREDSLKALVDDRYEAEAKQKKEEERELRIDWTSIDKPTSPDAFEAAFHYSPVPQYSSGTCWAFCSTSFFESEVYRQTGRKIKLSEMWTVYWEFVEKARRFVREYGHSNFGAGSQDHATREIYRQYGAVPAAAYPGVLAADGRHDHDPITKELRHYLKWVEKNGYWDEDNVIAYVRLVLDRHLGSPPGEFQFEGKSYTPKQFLANVLKLDMDDYISIMSTMREPYRSWTMLDVWDNWRRREDYLNLRLENFYDVVKSSVMDGYGVTFGGDVSEPGLDGMEDAAIIPSWDIPSSLIDQASRELRISNGTTGDDHGVHCIGYLRHGERDWFLVKDSNRSSRLGRFKGYYFYSGDYVKLKMLSCVVHRDRLEDLLPDDPRPSL